MDTSLIDLILNHHEINLLEQRRKSHIHNRELWSSIKKLLNGYENLREQSKICSDQIKHFIKLEKSVTWLISFNRGTSPAYSVDKLNKNNLVLNKIPEELKPLIQQEYYYVTIN